MPRELMTEEPITEPVQGPTLEDKVFAPSRRALTTGLLLAIAAFAVEGMGVVPALPGAVRELGGLALFGWAFSAFMLAWLVGSVAGGVLADARGPRLPMALGLLGFALGLVLAGSARAMAQFLAGRALQGAAGGSIIAAVFVAIARGYPDRARARMMALTSSVWILPAIVGPALSGAVAERYGWRFVFYGIVPLLAITSALVLPSLAAFDERRAFSGGRRIGASLGLAIGVGLLIASPSLHARGPLVMLAAACVGLLFTVPALRALLPRGTLRAAQGLPAGLLTRALVAVAYFGMEAFVPLASGELRHATPTEAGLALSAGALGWICASWLQDRIEARAGGGGRALRVRAGFSLLALGIVLVATTLVTDLPLFLVSVGWAIAGAGIGLVYSAGSLVCLAAAPASLEGQVSAQLQLAEALGTSAGAGLGGALLATLVRAMPHWVHGPAHLAVFAIALLSALLGVGVAGRCRAPATPA